MRDSQLDAYLVEDDDFHITGRTTNKDWDIEDIFEEIEEEMNENVAAFVMQENTEVKVLCVYCEGVGCGHCDDLGLMDIVEEGEMLSQWEVDNVALLAEIDAMCDEAIYELS